jgi:hypothetical protein
MIRGFFYLEVCLENLEEIFQTVKICGYKSANKKLYKTRKGIFVCLLSTKRHRYPNNEIQVEKIWNSFFSRLIMIFNKKFCNNCCDTKIKKINENKTRQTKNEIC